MAEQLPSNYPATLEAAKTAIQSARTRAVLAANTELIGLYWQLGRLVLDRQADEGWGSKVIQRLSNDLRAEFPEMTGLSRGNLGYMRRMATAWEEESICLRVVGRLPWGHIQTLLDKLDDPHEREWYARSAVEHGWSRAVLENQIMSQLHRRAGAAPSNFDATLPAGDSELMQQAIKDPYNLEFLDIAGDVAERDLEQALVDEIERFLRELGTGFAFVGRQWRLKVGGDEFFIDLLMFHIPMARYVIVELKTHKITPADIGQLNFYIAAIDGELALPNHSPTIGLLLCSARNEEAVRYTLSRTTSPMAVAGYHYDELPPAEQEVLPAEKELVEVVSHTLDRLEALDPTVDDQ